VTPSLLNSACSRSRCTLASLCLAAAVVVLGVPAAAAARAAVQDAATRPLHLKIKPAGVRSVELVPRAGGGYLYHVSWRDGHESDLPPDRFAELLYAEYSGRNTLFAVLNISSAVGIAWVVFGLLGQVLFTGRMLVQWLVSERRKRSVVPVSFWWMSLGGASMLVIYFVWRQDIVGVLGQSTGWVIYVRNLWLIYRHKDGVRESATA
jgi:lipid-A-disaccharide synthase-like uncharacterized protein